MEPILDVRHVTKIYRKNDGQSVTALDHVSFLLQSREVLGIAGESGSGKSTTAKVILGLTAPTEGSILLEGREISSLRGGQQREVYRSIQMVFQSPAGSFDPRRTLGFSIGESLRNAGMPKSDVKKRVNELLSQCGLTEDFAARYPHEVSGGQCQRAAVARALAAEPRILICDEATSALDVTVQKQLMDLLQTLKAQHGLSILFISHNLALMQDFCDRILIMKEGRIVESGPTDQVLTNPKDACTKSLIESVL